MLLMLMSFKSNIETCKKNLYLKGVPVCEKTLFALGRWKVIVLNILEALLSLFLMEQSLMYQASCSP